MNLRWQHGMDNRMREKQHNLIEKGKKTKQKSSNSSWGHGDESWGLLNMDITIHAYDMHAWA